MEGKIVKRKRGSVVRLVAELDASQSEEFNRITKQLGMTKVDAVSAALNIWLGMVAPVGPTKRKKGNP